MTAEKTEHKWKCKCGAVWIGICPPCPTCGYDGEITKPIKTDEEVFGQTFGIKSLAELKKWAEEAKYALHKKEGNEDDPDWYVIDADQVLEKINELETLSQTHIEQGKQTLKFLGWLIREVEAEYPQSVALLESLKVAEFTVRQFVALEDNYKKILRDKSGT
jgi:hypothetical protein